jgi:hypothetical protein
MGVARLYPVFEYAIFEDPVACLLCALLAQLVMVVIDVEERPQLAKRVQEVVGAFIRGAV